MPEISEDELHRLRKIERQYEQAQGELDWLGVPNDGSTVYGRLRWLEENLNSLWDQIRTARTDAQ